MVIWLKDSTGSLGVEDGIVRAEDMEQFLSLQDCRRVLAEQQEQLLELARQQAEEIVALAQQQAHDLLEEARQQAEHNAQLGYEEGQHMAVQEWQARQIGHTIDKAQTLRALHQKLAGIVTGAVERIVQTESREALYQRALDNVHGLTQGATALALRVHPDDYDGARNAMDALPEPPHGVALQVTADETLQPGSCVFESDLGVLDASLHIQLNGLRTAMDRAVRTAMADLEIPEPTEEAQGYEHEQEYAQQEYAQEHAEGQEYAAEAYHEQEHDESGEYTEDEDFDEYQDEDSSHG